MKKQKICIIGGGLTGLVTAITLSKYPVNVDLIADDVVKTNKSNKTVAISQSNYDFLKKLNFFKFSKSKFWPCLKMRLYAKNEKNKIEEVFNVNASNKKNILYMIQNSKMMSQMLEYINKNKSINLIKKKMVSEIISKGLLKTVKFKNIINSKYNLVIICTGSQSNLVKNMFDNNTFQRSYEQTSITTMLKHNYFENNIARQIFLDDEVLACLPISNTQTSIVWSVKKNTSQYKNSQDLFIKEKIKYYTKDFIKNLKFTKNIEYHDLHFLIRKQYYQDRILLFGDSLHVVHPIAGQGFNMILRDLSSLEKIIKNKISLGLDIGSNDSLSDFTKKTKPRNLLYSLGIDFLKNSFFTEQRTLKNFRNKMIINLNKNSFFKNLIVNIADGGI
tara:strand:+ start:415 stop:1581 length:1167 start_codon:yes stop_codon:yes gene_type:complete